jgi:hypothetical protein
METQQLGAPVCASMPSATSARDFMAGIPGSVPHLLVSYAGRTAIVAAGMYAAGKREHLARDAAAGAALIELSLLTYFSFEKNRGSSEMPSQNNVAQFLNGQPQYAAPILADVLLRALEISAGVALAGGSGDRQLRDALAGSVAVQLFIVAYAITFGAPCPPYVPKS